MCACVCLSSSFFAAQLIPNSFVARPLFWARARWDDPDALSSTRPDVVLPAHVQRKKDSQWVAVRHLLWPLTLRLLRRVLIISLVSDATQVISRTNDRPHSLLGSHGCSLFACRILSPTDCNIVCGRHFRLIWAAGARGQATLCPRGGITYERVGVPDLGQQRRHLGHVLPRPLC